MKRSDFYPDAPDTEPFELELFSIPPAAFSATDEDEDGVLCPACRDFELYMEEDGGHYFCPACGERITRAEFFDYIGAQLPGPVCLSCSQNYPGCKRSGVCFDYDVE